MYKDKTLSINQQSLDHFFLIAYITHKQNLHLEIHTYSPTVDCWGNQ